MSLDADYTGGQFLQRANCGRASIGRIRRVGRAYLSRPTGSRMPRLISVGMLELPVGLASKLDPPYESTTDLRISLPSGSHRETASGRPRSSSPTSVIFVKNRFSDCSSIRAA